MQTGCLYSIAIPLTALRESNNPVCCIRSAERRSQYESAEQIEIPSSSLHARTNLISERRDSGQSSPALVDLSGTATTTSIEDLTSVEMIMLPLSFLSSFMSCTFRLLLDKNLQKLMR